MHVESTKKALLLLRLWLTLSLVHETKGILRRSLGLLRSTQQVNKVVTLLSLLLLLLIASELTIGLWSLAKSLECGLLLLFRHLLLLLLPQLLVSLLFKLLFLPLNLRVV